MLHLQRGNFVAYDMRHSNLLKPTRDIFEHHGFSSDGNQIWSDKCVPEAIEDVLVRAEEDDVDEEIEEEDDIEDGEMDDVDVQTEDFS